MKKAFLAAIVVSAFFGSLIAGGYVEVTKAETLGPLVKWWHEFPSANHVAMFSPQNTTYYEASVFVNFTVKAFYSVYDVGYSLDEGPIERISDLTFLKSESTPGISILPTVYYLGSLYLSDLENGNHSITVYQGYQYSDRYEEEAYASVSFTINAAPPNVSILSIENETYKQSFLPLNLTIDKPTSWIGYSLDNQANITINKNLTLSGIIDGSHSLVIYANDTAGNMGKSDTVFFTINTQPSPSPTLSPSASPTQQPTSTPTQSATPTTVPIVMDGSDPILGIIAAAIVAITVVGLAVYYAKFRKKKTAN